MKNKIQMVVKEVEFGRVEVSYMVSGDIWKWLKKKGDGHKAVSVFNDALDKEVHTFYYESQAEKFIKKYTDVVDSVVRV